MKSLVPTQRSQEAKLWCRLNYMSTPLCTIENMRFISADFCVFCSKPDQHIEKHLLEKTSKFLLKKVLDRKGHSRE